MTGLFEGRTQDVFIRILILKQCRSVVSLGGRDREWR